MHVYGREQEAPAPLCQDTPENLHVLVRGKVSLPQSGQYELLVAADDHYQLWTDGVYRGQGPMSGYSDRCFYDSYSVENCSEGCPSGKLLKNAKEECTKMHGKDQCGQITVALHLYYHGRLSRSWDSRDGRFGF